MKVFRLVLCLAGLAVYLVVRPAVEPSSSPKMPASPPVTPETSKPRAFTVETSHNDVTPTGSLPANSMVR